MILRDEWVPILFFKPIGMFDKLFLNIEKMVPNSSNHNTWNIYN
jgi:hypothetical protein